MSDADILALCLELERQLMEILKVEKPPSKREIKKSVFEVDDAIPGWRNIVTGSRFQLWIKSQSQFTQELMSSWHPDDAIHVIRKYQQRPGRVIL